MEKCDDTWDVRYEHANVYISSSLNTTLSESQLITAKVQTSMIFSKIKERWEKSSRNREKFFSEKRRLAHAKRYYITRCRWQ